MSDDVEFNPVELATEITIAWLNNPNNRVTAEDVPAFLRSIHGTVNELMTGSSAAEVEEAAPQEHKGAVTARRSLASKDHILSMIDGKPYKTLTRHLSTHGLTPAEYRSRYGLRPDYPMVAENYATHRRELAKRIGLGRKPATAAAPADTDIAGNGRAKAPAAKRRAAKSAEAPETVG